MLQHFLSSFINSGIMVHTTSIASSTVTVLCVKTAFRYSAMSPSINMHEEEKKDLETSHNSERHMLKSDSQFYLLIF